MKCPKCGNDVSSNDKFCNNCGFNLEDESKNETNIPESTENIQSSNLNIWEKIKSALKDKVILATVIVISLFIVFGVYKSIEYANQIKEQTYSVTLSNMGKTDIKVKYNTHRNECLTTFVFNEIMGADWMNEMFNNIVSQEKANNPNYQPGKVTMATNGVQHPYIFEYDSVIIEDDKPVSMTFIVPNITTLQEYVKYKTIVSKENKAFQMTYAFLNLITKDAESRKAYEAQYNQEKQDLAEEEAAIDIAKYYALVDESGNKVGLHVNPRKCLFKVKGICFGHPFMPRGLTYEECKSYKDSLGVESCSEEEDIYAATALVCGGVENMPSLSELVVLAQDMYGTNDIDNVKSYDDNKCWDGVGRMGGVNYGTCNTKSSSRLEKDYVEIFRDMYWSNKSFKNAEEEKQRKDLLFTIISKTLNNEYRRANVYARVFGPDFTSFGYAHRYTELEPARTPSGSSTWKTLVNGICVDRKNSIPLKVNYPIQNKDFNKEAEDRFF